ncbi:MAG: glycoside hydrolase family 3 C-terminal domain-containing protein [Anaerolineae bacterium]|nr:glycoside hydrolase family 3 C-terminal domain-containing protein [Anaerolineae bacterium]
MKRDIKHLVRHLTLEEKASLCSGQDAWRTKAIERLGIPSIMMTDGPHGLRKVVGEEGQLAGADTVPATCFPSGATLAASWDRAVMARVGRAIAREAQAEGVRIVLGPAVNIKRSPLCGRNFEYLSEDPYLVGELARAYISAVQAEGVGTSIKHFAANNQETRRLTIDTIVDERTLREIYLPGFETAVKKAQPWTVMAAYNRLNGTYCTEHPWLLTEVLRDDWGYEGAVVSDWGAVNDRPAGVAAGLALEMPGGGEDNDRLIVEAVRAGTLDEAVLDRAVERLLRLIFRAADGCQDNATYDAAAHHALARKVAGECAVLLKNEDAILPLPKKGTIAFVGAFAKDPRYQGGGSSHVNPSRMDTAYDAAVGLVGERAEITYAPGYIVEAETIDAPLRAEAQAVAAAADVAVVFIGLTDVFESEGYDRTHLGLPANHIALLAAVREVQENVVVVLSNGSPVAMPWLDQAKAVLEGYLGGQAGGGAIVDVLFGEVNPSGKLAETLPARLEDTPAYLNFPGDATKVVYAEGLHVGYRYYDARALAPLFPFGHGLSYTTFAYSNLIVDKTTMTDAETVTASVTITNTGEIAGKEVVQLYVRDIEATVIRPPKELKGFDKVELAPGETTTVAFMLDKRAFAYWDEARGDWHVETGDFEILVGASSADIRLRTQVTVMSTTETPVVYDWNTTLGEMRRHPLGQQLLQRALASGPFDDLDPDSPTGQMMAAMMRELPFRTAILFSGGRLTRDDGQLILDVLNGVRRPTALLGLLMAVFR